jgi:hypothetical protein
VFGQLGDELFARGDVAQGRGDQGLRREGGVTFGEVGERGEGGRVDRDEAGEDGELARDVRTREVVGRVRLLYATDTSKRMSIHGS